MDNNNFAGMSLADMMQLSPDVLKGMSLDDIMTLRYAAGKNLDIQKKLAPYDHRAFAREAVGQNPLMAIPYSTMIPAYYGAKKIGLLQSDDPNHPTTPPSWEQMKQGFTGIGEGLLNFFSR